MHTAQTNLRNLVRKKPDDRANTGRSWRTPIHVVEYCRTGPCWSSEGRVQVGTAMKGLKELQRGSNLVVLFLMMWALEVSS